MTKRDYGQCDDLVKQLVKGVRDGTEEEWMIVAGTLMALLADAMHESPEVYRMIEARCARYS